jgi:hypothetical protein
MPHWQSILKSKEANGITVRFFCYINFLFLTLRLSQRVLRCKQPRGVARQFAAQRELHRRNSLPPLNDKMVQGALWRAEAQNKRHDICRAFYFEEYYAN